MTERSFTVYPRHLGAHHAWRVSAASAESAVVAFIEAFHPTDDSPLRLVVLDGLTGHQHCYQIDLEQGEAIACD